MKPEAERLVVDAEKIVEVDVYEIPNVEDAAERAVVEAFVAVRVVMNADASVAPVAERLVVEALVIVAVPVVLVLPNDAPVAERLVVDATVMVVVASVVVPVNVLSPAKVCEVVETRPREVTDAVGILKYWIDTASLRMAKSFAIVEVATRVCPAAVKPLIEVIPPPAPASAAHENVLVVELQMSLSEGPEHGVSPAPEKVLYT